MRYCLCGRAPFPSPSRCTQPIPLQTPNPPQVHIMGSIFYSVLAVTLLPFASLSLFIYDRQFYSGEAASKLYTSRHGVWRVETCVDICLCWWYRYGCVCVCARARAYRTVRQPHTY